MQQPDTHAGQETRRSRGPVRELLLAGLLVLGLMVLMTPAGSQDGALADSMVAQSAVHDTKTLIVTLNQSVDPAWAVKDNVTVSDAEDPASAFTVAEVSLADDDTSVVVTMRRDLNLDMAITVLLNDVALASGGRDVEVSFKLDTLEQRWVEIKTLARAVGHSITHVDRFPLGRILEYLVDRLSANISRLTKAVSQVTSEGISVFENLMRNVPLGLYAFMLLIGLWRRFKPANGRSAKNWAMLIGGTLLILATAVIRVAAPESSFFAAIWDPLPPWPATVAVCLLGSLMAWNLARKWWMALAYAGLAVILWLYHSHVNTGSIAPVALTNSLATILIFTLMVWYMTKNRSLSFLSMLGLLLILNMGLWDVTVSTIALVLVSTLVAIAVGIPLGIGTAMSRTIHKTVMPILDVMQTMPAFVYLIPAIPFFGLGKVAAIFSTVIFAMPPAIRLTCLGIRQVPVELVECADAFGSTRWQKLFKLQLPLATPTIMAGVNQTVMLALSMVVIAAMIGAKGLGGEVWKAIQRLRMGDGFEAGIGIVIVAMILDRVLQRVGGNKQSA